MGLFSSMVPLPSAKSSPRFIMMTDARKRQRFDVHVWRSHVTVDEVQALATQNALMQTNSVFTAFGHVFRERFLCDAVLYRTYCHPDVIRQPVVAQHNGHKIRGFLFLPPGEGPFPGVVDLFGGFGRCLEFRAALLAKHGFATLALGYMAYEDLRATETHQVMDMGQFEAAVDWLCCQPKVCSQGCGIVAVSLGSYFALNTAIRKANVLATVCINGTYMMPSDGLFESAFCRDRLPEMLQMIPKQPLAAFRDGEYNKRPVNTSAGVLPLVPRPLLSHTHDNAILLVASALDGTQHSSQVADDILKQFHKSAKRNIEKLVVPGAGHLLEPPYAPLCRRTFTPTSASDYWTNSRLGYVTNQGGDHDRHEESAVYAWTHILHFLHTHLPKHTVTAKI